jgi:hypothetical protein
MTLLSTAKSPLAFWNCSICDELVSRLSQFMTAFAESIVTVVVLPTLTPAAPEITCGLAGVPKASIGTLNSIHHIIR